MEDGINDFGGFIGFLMGGAGMSDEEGVKGARVAYF